jgi:hypothetical protein
VFAWSRRVFVNNDPVSLDRSPPLFSTTPQHKYCSFCTKEITTPLIISILSVQFSAQLFASLRAPDDFCTTVLVSQARFCTQHQTKNTTACIQATKSDTHRVSLHSHSAPKYLEYSLEEKYASSLKFTFQKVGPLPLFIPPLAASNIPHHVVPEGHR